jgi:hypothetical protein
MPNLTKIVLGFFSRLIKIADDNSTNYVRCCGTSWLTESSGSMKGGGSMRATAWISRRLFRHL